jgi:hypothetical protein
MNNNFCTSCGQPRTPESKFCSHCGFGPPAPNAANNTRPVLIPNLTPGSVVNLAGRLAGGAVSLWVIAVIGIFLLLGIIIFLDFLMMGPGIFGALLPSNGYRSSQSDGPDFSTVVKIIAGAMIGLWVWHRKKNGLSRRPMYIIVGIAIVSAVIFTVWAAAQ